MDRNLLIKRRLRLRDLDTLLVVAQCGSMAKAASQLSISQSAISKAIADMERVIGARLLDRTSQGVEPTVYGRALLRSSTAIFDDLRLGVSEISSLSDPAVGDVRITASEPVSAGILPEVVVRLSKSFPRISISVQSAPIASLQVREPPYRDLHERKVDLVLGPIVNPLSDEAIQAESLFEDHFVIVAGSKNPLTRRRTIKLADLLEERWILPPLDTTVGVACVNAFRLSGLQVPERKIESSAILLQIGLLATEDLVTIFPSSLVRFGAERFAIQALPIKIAVRPPPIGIITLKGRTISPAVQRFIDAVREVAKLSLPRK